MIHFESIGNGELAGMFRQALSQIGRNIMDPNMDPEAARGMTINIRFKPGKTGTISVSYDVKTKLAGMAKSETVFLIGQDVRTGKIEMSEYGNNRPQVAAYESLSPSAGVGTESRDSPSPEPDFDPETGEVYESGKPIDLRAGRNVREGKE